MLLNTDLVRQFVKNDLWLFRLLAEGENMGGIVCMCVFIYIHVHNGQRAEKPWNYSVISNIA